MPNFCCREPPPRLPFSGSGVIFESVASAGITAGGPSLSATFGPITTDRGKGATRRQDDDLISNRAITMKPKPPSKLRDGVQCKVIGGTHAGKSGAVRDIRTSKTGYVSITVVQSNGERIKTLAKNVVIQTGMA